MQLQLAVRTCRAPWFKQGETAFQECWTTENFGSISRNLQWGFKHWFSRFKLKGTKTLVSRRNVIYWTEKGKLMQRKGYPKKDKATCFNVSYFLKHLFPFCRKSHNSLKMTNTEMMNTHIMNFFNWNIGFCWQPQVLWLYINNYQYLVEKHILDKIYSRTRRNRLWPTANSLALTSL